MSQDEQFMRKALIEAQAAYDEGEIPIGAIIVCRDRIISRAHNLTETLNDVTAHAEMQAITAAANALGGKYLTDCTLYVTVEPCHVCRCHRLGTDSAHRLRSTRREAWLPQVCPKRLPSQGNCGKRSTRGGMSVADAGFLQGEKIKEEKIKGNIQAIRHIYL